MSQEHQTRTDPNNDHVLALSRDESTVPVTLQLTVAGHQQALLVLGQKLHREVNVLQLYIPDPNNMAHEQVHDFSSHKLACTFECSRMYVLESTVTIHERRAES